MSMRGVVESVETVNDGDFLTADHSSGSTVLAVDNTDVFETETLTGSVQLNGVVYDYTDVDSDASTITVPAGLSADADSGDSVYAYPLAPSKIAYVAFGDNIGDAMSVRVPHFLAAYVALTDGPRASLAGQSVEVDSRDGELVLYDVLGRPSSIDPAAIDGGGGGTDGGNDDDGFTLPTLSEFVFDGDPDYWVTFDGAGNGRVFTEDEANAAFSDIYFVEDVVVSGGTLTIPLVEVPDWVSPTDTTTVYPAWVVPLVGQDSKFTIDSAVAYGTHDQDDPSDPWNGSVQSFLYFGSMIDDPWSGRSWSQEDNYEMSVLNNTSTGGVDSYFQRTWSAGFGDEPLPASSSDATYAANNKQALLVVLPIYITTGGGTPTFTAGSTYTGVRMEQA